MLMGEESLRSPLDHLASGRHEQDQPWPNGRVTRITGGWSNLLYRVRGPSYDWAVKFTLRDERDSQGRSSPRASRTAGATDKRAW